MNEDKNTQSHIHMPRFKCPQRKSGVEKKVPKTEKNQKKALRTSSQSEKCDEKKKKKDRNNDRRFSCVFLEKKT